jgi:UDP-2,4-diacetamido-2,4,6-trideoxy-beta-L-altropyranose hydrolase
MTPRVMLVAECGRGVGLGHVERALALADALEPRIASTVAIPRDDVIIERVTARGYEPLVLRGGIGQRAATAARLKQPVALIVDAYNLAVSCQRELHSLTPLVVVDDLAHECDCDLAVNPSAGGADLKPSGARAFIGGADYAVMSSPYRVARATHAEHPPHSGRVLVGTGAMAFGGLGLKIAGELVTICPAAQVTLVLGPEAEIPGAGAHDPRITILASPATLADLLAEHSLFVGAAGTTALQAACVGLPSVIFPVVANQQRQATQLASAGCAVLCTINDAAAVAAHLIGDNATLAGMSAAGRSLVDGLGADRVAAAVLSLIAGGVR